MTSDRAYLMEAASVIEKRGHCQRAYTNGSGFCILGALRVALSTDVGPAVILVDRVTLPQRLHAEKLGDLVARHLGITADDRDIAEWNDSPSRTAEEVITALRETAENLPREECA